MELMSWAWNTLFHQCWQACNLNIIIRCASLPTFVPQTWCCKEKVFRQSLRGCIQTHSLLKGTLTWRIGHIQFYREHYTSPWNKSVSTSHESMGSTWFMKPWKECEMQLDDGFHKKNQTAFKLQFIETHTHLLASSNFPWVSAELIRILFSCTTCSTIHTKLYQQHSSHAKPHLSWQVGPDHWRKLPWQITGLMVSRECSGELLHSLHHYKLERGIRFLCHFCFYIRFLRFGVSGMWNSFPPFFSSSHPTSLYNKAAVLQTAANAELKRGGGTAQIDTMFAQFFSS